MVIADFAVLATMVVVLPGVQVGRDALGGTLPGEAQRPSRDNCCRYSGKAGGVSPRAIIREGPKAGQPAYPWRDHFDRGMPWEGSDYDTWSRGR